MTAFTLRSRSSVERLRMATGENNAQRDYTSLWGVLKFGVIQTQRGYDGIWDSAV